MKTKSFFKKDSKKEKDSGKDSGKDSKKRFKKDSGKDSKKGFKKRFKKDSEKDSQKGFKKRFKKDSEKDSQKGFKKRFKKDSEKDSQKGFRKRFKKDSEKDSQKGFKKRFKKDSEKDSQKGFRKGFKKDSEKDSKKGFRKRFKKDSEKDSQKGFKKRFKKDSEKDSQKGFRKGFKKDSEKDSQKGFKKRFKKDSEKDSQKGFRKGFKKDSEKDSKKGFRKRFKKDSEKDSKKGFRKGFKKDSEKDSKKGFRKSFRKDSKKDFKKGFKRDSKPDSKNNFSDNESFLKEYKIPHVFKSKKLENLVVSEKDLEKREDLTSLPFVTIDGLQAKDYDDAIYVESTKTGWVLYVSIADVDFYVKEGTPLDQEAFERGNSTYFPDFVSPMLPFYLSQDLCSLNPHERRLTMTAQLFLDSKGNIEKSLFYESYIVNHARLTYEQAQDIIDQKQSFDLPSDLVESVQKASQLAKILFEKRIKEGSLNLDIPETEIKLDAKGNPIDIFQFKRLFSHQVIEEMMLACNKAVGEFLNQKKIPSIYRLHDVPETENIDHLKKFIKSIDSSLIPDKKENTSQISFQQYLSNLIQNTKNHPQKNILHHLVLRSLPQACYGSYNRGHFGLGFEFYTHFTSPIRRYSDLIVHRILKNVLGISKQQKTKDELEKQAQWLTQCEQRSMQAERKIESIKKAQFMSQYLGEEFQGMISSITQFGFFVTLNKFDVDGLIHVRSLKGRWNFIPSQLLLRGQSSGYKFKQGDVVLVQVASTFQEKGQIDFKLLQHNQKVFYNSESKFRQKKSKTQYRPNRSEFKKRKFKTPYKKTKIKTAQKFTNKK